MINHRYDEFLDVDKSVLLTAEPITVPAGSPYYVSPREIPKESFPSTLLLRAAGSGSQSIPDQDCGTSSGSTGANDNGGSIYVGRDSSGAGGALYRGFIRFDVSALAAVAASAKLRLFIIAGLVGTAVGVHKVTSSWTETGPTWASSPTFDPVASSQFSVPNVPPNTGGFQGWIECDITALYNAWKAGTNNGLMLRADESVYDTKHSAYSRSAGGAEPQLVVVSAGNNLVEVSSTIAPGPMQFACHYGTGRLRFNAADASKALELDYRGTGSAVQAEDIWIVTPPSTSSSPGIKGQRAFDTSYAYHCVADNTWARVAHASF